MDKELTNIKMNLMEIEKIRSLEKPTCSIKTTCTNYTVNIPDDILSGILSLVKAAYLVRQENHGRKEKE